MPSANCDEHTVEKSLRQYINLPRVRCIGCVGVIGSTSSFATVRLYCIVGTRCIWTEDCNYRVLVRDQNFLRTCFGFKLSASSAKETPTVTLPSRLWWNPPTITETASIIQRHWGTWRTCFAAFANGKTAFWPFILKKSQQEHLLTRQK